MAPTFLRKMGSISPCFTQSYQWPQKFFPKNENKNLDVTEVAPTSLRPKWAAFRPALHTKLPFFPKNASKNSSPKSFPQKICPRILPPKIINMKWVQKSWHHGPNISEKNGQHFALFYTQTYQRPQKNLPQTFFPKVLPPKSLTSNGRQRVLTSWPQQFWEKWAAFRPVLHTKIPMAPEILPQEFFPKSSSPQSINIEWVQKNLDIMAPAILRKMGSILPCFTHKPKGILPKFFPKNSSPKILPQKFFPKNSSPKILSQKIIDIEWVQNIPNNSGKNGQHFALFYTQTKSYSPKNSSPKILPQKILPQKFFPKNSSPKILPPKNYWHRMGAKNSWNHGPNTSEKNGQHFALFYTQTKRYSPKILPLELLLTNSSPKILAPIFCTKIIPPKLFFNKNSSPLGLKKNLRQCYAPVLVEVHHGWWWMMFPPALPPSRSHPRHRPFGASGQCQGWGRVGARAGLVLGMITPPFYPPSPGTIFLRGRAKGRGV